MNEQKVPRSVEQRIVIKFLVGENVPSAEMYGEECLLRWHSSPYCCWSLWWISADGTFSPTRNLITMRFSTLRGTFCSLITLATPRRDWTGSNPSRMEGGGCGFTLSRSHSCCAVRLVYTQISPGHIWTTLYFYKAAGHLSVPTLHTYWRSIRNNYSFCYGRLQASVFQRNSIIFWSLLRSCVCLSFCLSLSVTPSNDSTADHISVDTKWKIMVKLVMDLP